MGSIKSTKLRAKRNRPPDGKPWVWLTRELLESDAWRTMPTNTRRFVDRLMLEHMAHAGTGEGRLICTARQCVAWGMHPSAVTEAQRDACRRGLVYLSEKGCFAPRRGRRPNRFGLGWLPSQDGSPAPNRWKSWLATPQEDINSAYNTRDKINGGKRQERSRAFLNMPTPPSTVMPTPPSAEKMNSRKDNLLTGNLPPGWKIGKADDGHVRALRPGTPKRPWIGVPIIRGLGDHEEQEAYRELQQWRANGGVTYHSS
jgi:hypothetical protein